MTRSLIALALAAAFSMSANASDISYTYAEGGYVNFDGDHDGFGLRGSFNFGQSDFYGFAGYSQVEIDGTNVDIDSTNIGLGYHHALSERAHLLAELSYVNADAGIIDLDGYRASVGVRGAFSDHVEGVLKANYTDGSDLDGDVSGTAGLLVKFNPTWGISGEVEFADGGETYMLGLRASF
ncbi:MAG TPA: Ax21 family protein [Arenimonas sp.]|nr:Ax21 family protein [Arenimonas sp.]